MRFQPFVLSALLLTVSASIANAQPVIDDFETGSFQASTTLGGMPEHESVPVIFPSHAMAAVRQVTLIPGNIEAHVTAEVAAAANVDDKLVFHTDSHGGELRLRYTPFGLADLTAGGWNDRVEVQFMVVTIGGVIELLLEDSFGGSVSDSVVYSGGGSATVTFWFASLWGFVDLEHLTSLEVRVRHDEGSNFHISDIRGRRVNSSWAKFDAPVESVVGPPFPTPRLIFDVSNATPAGTQEIRVVNAKKIASGAATHLVLQGMDSGGDVAAGEVGAVSWSWNEPSAPWSNTAFDLQVDVNAVSGVDPQPFLPALPALILTSTGFLLQFDVHYENAGGQVVKTSRRQMAFDVRPGQALQLRDVRVIPPDQILGDDLTSFRVTFDAVAAGGVDVAETLFETMFTGDISHATATSAPDLIGAGSAQGLAAFPAVTSAGAELRLARPAELAGRIDLFDVTGRQLRRFEIPRGSSGATWDGAASGVTASGVYFARFTDGRSECVARIVKVR